MNGFVELGTPVVKGLANAGLSRCDEATGDLESADGRYTDAFKSARWPPNRASPPQRSMAVPASLPAAAIHGPERQRRVRPSAPTAGATGTLRLADWLCPC